MEKKSSTLFEDLLVDPRKRKSIHKELAKNKITQFKKKFNIFFTGGSSLLKNHSNPRTIWQTFSTLIKDLLSVYTQMPFEKIDIRVGELNIIDTAPKCSQDRILESTMYSWG